MGKIIKRGEIHWYHFKSPDKKRPVLILTRDSIMEYLGEVTIAPITTRQQAVDFSTGADETAHEI